MIGGSDGNNPEDVVQIEMIGDFGGNNPGAEVQVSFENVNQV